MDEKPGICVKSTILVLILLLGTFFAVMTTDTVVAEQDGDYTYATSGSPLVATVTGYTGTGGAISIPSTLGGYPTRAIGDYAFNGVGGRSITMATIPYGVASIGNYAFASCSQMTSVSIPDSVTSISTGAFTSCTALTSAVLPQNLTSIESFLFSNCPALMSAHIPEKVTGILTYAFSQCSSLTSVDIPKNVTGIGYGAFISCTALTSVIIGDGVTDIAIYAFSDCVALNDLRIGCNVTRIGINAFSGCTALTAVVVPGSVTSIGAGGFAQCSSLTRMQFDGDAPSCGLLWIAECSPDLIAYYRSGAAGFTDPWEGIPTVMMTPPSTPLDIVAFPGSSQARLSWTAPGSDGNCSVSAYEVYYGTEDTLDRFFGSFGPTARMANITGLQPAGTVFCFAVRAINEVGASPMSAVVHAIPYTVPGAPILVTATAGVEKVTISWQAPNNDGGNAIAGYNVYRALAGGSEVLTTVGAGTLSYVDTKGTVGTTYTYYIVASNAAGAGANSSQVSATPQSAAVDNTMLYVGVVIAIIAVIAIAVVLMRRKK
ncbi:MAG: leucine-rich repeat protein [Methanomassiliicoccales archaeon]